MKHEDVCFGSCVDKCSLSGTGVLLLFAVFSVLLCVCTIGYLLMTRECKPIAKVVSPFIEAPFLILQVTTHGLQKQQHETERIKILSNISQKQSKTQTVREAK